MNPNKTKPPEEIDLLYFFSPLINFLRRVISIVGNYLLFLLRNAWLFLGVFFALGFLSFSLRYVLPHYYQTNAVYLSKYLPVNISMLMVDELKGLAGNEHSRISLAQKLMITGPAAAAIHAIDAQPLNSEDYKYKYDTAAGAVFNIRLTLSDISALEDIQHGIQQFLESNAYSVNRKMARKKTLEIMRRSLIDKNKSLDSLKAVFNAGLASHSNGQVVIMNQPNNALELYELQQNILKERLLIEKDLADMENIDIIQPFSKPAAYNYPNFNKIFFYCLIASLLLSAIITIFAGKR